MDPDGGAVAPQRGLPLPGIDLNDADAMADVRPVSINSLRRKRKIGTAMPENADHQNKRRKTTTYLDVSASSSSALSSPDASNDASSMAQAVRRMLSSESPSGSSTPLSSGGMHQGHKMIKVDDCVMCCASALDFKGIDMVRVPTYVTEWIHAHLSEHKWDSIWKDLEALSKYLCATARRNNIDLHFMTADDWLNHYLNETRDQYVWYAHNQIEYRFLHQELKNGLFYEPDGGGGGGAARLAFAHQNNKHCMDLLKVNLRLNDKAAEMAKSTLSGGNNSQVDNARRSTIVSYILTNASK
jgi:hypothetical protein